METLDFVVLVLYFLGVLGVGAYFLRRQTGLDEYLVGNRKITSTHLGLSVVATDVGGGFTVGLGGVGFLMGISGSWMLFTGLIGAWLAAVILIPRIKPLADEHQWRSFPDYLQHRYGDTTRGTAALLSGIAYAGFTGGQVLAGAKLVHGAFPEAISIEYAAIIMGFVVIAYTAMGGLEAVIYTDSVQWTILLGGLLFFGVPVAWDAVGGWEGMQEAFAENEATADHMNPFAVFKNEPMTFVSWILTITPIWFVAMTLYQRICAASDLKTAKRAWFIAGLLEWPTIAMLGTILGMCSRVLYPDFDAEGAMPRMLAEYLPIGITGLVLASFFSAVMSTADSCLLAAVGHVTHDMHTADKLPIKGQLRQSRFLTVVIGALSVGVALASETVMEAILGAYQVLVSGLFVPTLGGLLWKRGTSAGALSSVCVGGGTALALIFLPPDTLATLFGEDMPKWFTDDPIITGLPVSLITYVMVSLFTEDPHKGEEIVEEAKGIVKEGKA